MLKKLICFLFLVAIELQAGGSRPLKKAQALALQRKWWPAERSYLKALAENPNVIEGQFTGTVASESLPAELIKIPTLERGEQIEGKSILVYAVKGNGDTLQFCRFIRNLADQKPKQLTLVSQKGLKALLSESFKDVSALKVIEELPKGAGFDRRISLLAIPDILDLPESKMTGTPYLTVSNNKIEQARLGTGAFKIGIVFSGNPDHPHNKDRSFELKWLKRISEIPSVKLYSLQPKSEETISRELPSIDVSLLPKLVDYEMTAAYIKNLDLVLSADTSVCHLAAALGKPTWVPLSRKTDLRFVGAGDSTFWYSNMRLFRQVKQGDWSHPFSEIEKELRKKTKKDSD